MINVLGVLKKNTLRNLKNNRNIKNTIKLVKIVSSQNEMLKILDKTKIDIIIIEHEIFKELYIDYELLKNLKINSNLPYIIILTENLLLNNTTFSYKYCLKKNLVLEIKKIILKYNL